jgi:hypothetical protein
MISNAQVDELMKLDGKVRGAVFETDAEYVRNRCGNEGMERVLTALSELGYPVSYEKIRSMEWLPLGLRAVSLIVIKDTFKWKDEDIKDMGDAAPKYSFIVKLLMKFFVSPRVAFNHAPEYWVKHYDIGRLEAVDLDESTGNAVIHLYDFNVHRLYCRYLEGYFQRLFKFMYPNSRVKIREGKCMCKHDTFHEFLVTTET